MYLTVMTFRDQMKRLEAYLGKRMSDAMREEYFGRLNHQIIDELFHLAIDRLIDDGKTHFLPLVSEIIDAYETERAGISYKENVYEPCDDCNGTGLFFREDKEGHAWVSPCRCGKGQRIRRGWEKRGIDKLIRRQEHIYGRAIEAAGEDDFNPEDFEAPAPPPAPAKNPFDL